MLDATSWQFVPVTFLCAELLLLLVRNKEFLIVVKRANQRTATEQKQMDRGLLRSLAVEIFVLVPASAVLMLVIVRPFVLKHIAADTDFVYATYGMLGIVSYGFPFGTIRAIAVRMSLKMLTDFAAVTLQNTKAAESIEGLRDV